MAADDDPLAVLTAAIERGGMAPVDLAALYNSRGAAFTARNDLAQAAADFGQAIALRPGFADAYVNRAGVYFAQGQFDRAVGDYSAALRVHRTEASLYIGRAQAYYFLKRYADSIADLKLAAKYSPASRHAPLWLYLAEWRAGRNPATDLAANPVRWTAREWPGPLFALYLGNGTADAALAAARNSDPVTQRSQECEARFYSGEYLLTRGAAADATGLLRRSLDVCPAWRTLHAAARLELARAGTTH
jgi:lipoprotein NlpI